MINAAIITVSDKGSKGERVDGTGAAIRAVLEKQGFSIEYYKIVPDEIDSIEKELIYLSDEVKIDIVFTNGGTGFSQRDVTPEATQKVIQKYIPGFGEAMRAKSLEITPKAMLSRAIAGIRNSTIIVNLPGSPKGAVENLEVILPAIPHGLSILKGQESECAR